MTSEKRRKLIDVWKWILASADTPWVLFEHGTCVLLTEPEGDPAEQATQILREFGPVSVGGPSGDFSVRTITGDAGWLVTSHHPDVVTFVAPDEPADPSHLAVGIHGRSKRHEDGTAPHVVHVEDGRPTAP
ncbi:hypothetical protein [Streptomyces sp. NPDC018610]|uniref:hypothetical protein n=1 Tax=Streptomyces sp. NPDC018610 TaxID=3365049 RepID=UPI003792E974